MFYPIINTPTSLLPNHTIWTNQPYHSDQPLIRLLGISPDFNSAENENKINNLLSEIVKLHKDNNKPMSFTYIGNDKPDLVVTVLKRKNYVSFNKNQQRHKR